MVLTAKTIARANLLLISVAGDFSLEEAKRSFLEKIKSIEEHSSEKILVDGRAISGNPEVIERFYYSEFAADAVKQLRDRGGDDKNPQFAYVLHEPVLDPLRFGETVAINRGMNIKVFDNLDEALEWLELTPEEIADLGDSS